MSHAPIDPAIVRLRHEWRPEDSRLIVDLHADGYASLGARFDDRFLAHVAETVEEAALDRAGHRSRVWFAETPARTLGLAAMIDRGDAGQLRWVVLLPEARGLGIGRALFEAAIGHACRQDWQQIFLHTTDGLDASMRLYRQNGFAVASDEEDDLWHGRGRLIVMTRQL